jgi:DNA polymerase-1
VILIVDGMNLFIRSASAVPTLRSDREYHPGGLMGFLRSMRSVMLYHPPRQVFVAWDASGGSRKRKRIYSAYKGGKTSTKSSADFKEETKQMDMLREYLELLGVHQRKVTGIEADDIIAQVCKYYADEDKVILTSDKDMMQLVGDKTKVYSLSKKRLVGTQQVVEDFGVLPTNLVYMRAMVGDKSDNINGVKGIGEISVPRLFPYLAEKTATIEEIRSTADSLKDELDTRKNSVKPTSRARQYTALIEQWDVFERNVELMRLTLPKDKEISKTVKEEIEKKFEISGSAFRFRCVRDKLPYDECNRFWAIFSRVAERQLLTEGDTDDVRA